MTDNVVNLSPNRILSKCWRLLPVSPLRTIVFPPQNSDVTSRRAAGSICFLLAVCFIIDEREREWGAACIIFIPREMWGRTGGASRNRKRCKPKGKHPGRGFGKYRHSVRVLGKHLADSRCTAGGRSRLAPPPPDLHSHAVLADSCTPAASLLGCTSMQVWTPTLWSTGGLTRICKVVVFVDLIVLYTSGCCIPIFLAFWGVTGGLHGVPGWTLTWSWVGLFSAGCRECFAARAKLNRSPTAFHQHSEQSPG